MQIQQRFGEVKNLGTPAEKTWGVSWTQGYLALLFATGGANGWKRKKPQTPQRIIGLQGV
jgi:hypothetical protein